MKEGFARLFEFLLLPVLFKNKETQPELEFLHRPLLVTSLLFNIIHITLESAQI